MKASEQKSPAQAVCSETVKGELSFMDVIRPTDSDLSNRQVRDYIQLAESWIQENYWDYDEYVFEDFLPALKIDKKLVILLAESIDSVFDSLDRDASKFRTALQAGIHATLLQTDF